MSITLILEHAPHPQTEPRRRIEAGEVTIGRGSDADWQIDDPDMFVSRRHCVVSVTEDGARVTDASRGGLFVDGASQPLGPGNSVDLEHGMRLRLGDFVLRVEAAEAERPEPGSQRRSDFIWGDAAPAGPAPPRPESLPEPYEREAKPTPRAERPPAAEDDPFSLGDLAPPAAPPAPPEPNRSGSYFDTPSPEPPAKPAPPTPDAAEPPPAPHLAPVDAPAPSPERPDAVHQHPQAPDALRAAFFRGLGLDPARHPTDDPAAEMEAMGARFRLLVEGLVQLLHNRAQEKQNVRVAQTVIGRADVNPLKVSASTDDAVTSLIASRGGGYLDPEPAIHAAYRDLADHQLRTWSALQTALRRMIDRFEPQAIEQELEAAGLLEVLLAGGRGAKLWQLYQQRYRDIARSAEERFLGEVGADFRNAYERMEEKTR